MEIRFTKHVLERMFERDITPEECEYVALHGKVIEEYQDDSPFPSKLILGEILSKFLPDSSMWKNDFSRRKKEKR